MISEKPKLLFVMNNMCMGGIQKALVSLLVELAPYFEITLLLFWKSGPLIDEIPHSIKVIETKSLFRYIGMAQKDCSTILSKFIRGVLVVITRILGRSVAIRLMKSSVKKDHLEQYNAIISYSHCQSPKMFYAGTAEYVLSLPSGNNKICYIHCDYKNSGTSCKENNRIYRRFNKIICVSESVRNGFLKILPDMKDKVIVIENPINCEKVRELSLADSVMYNSAVVNILSVARLGKEKGILRVVKLLASVSCNDFKYYVIGDGDQKSECEKVIDQFGLNDKVVLVGETVNPYRYMKNADLLLVPSYHEAAPVVYQEAKALALPVLTTKTLSASEIIGEKYGWVVENTDRQLKEKLLFLLAHKDEIIKKKEKIVQLKETKIDIVDFYKKIIQF